MAERITWTPLALRKRREILQYWLFRNKSKNYSIKLSKLFKEATELISVHPTIGKPTDDANVRFKIVRDYLMFYSITEDGIFILTIWDSRQNPEGLKIKVNF